MCEPLKNSGAASPVCQGKEGARARIMLNQESKNVSPFCKDCREAAWNWQNISVWEFVDRLGLCWHCFRPFTCDHAVVYHGRIEACRLRVTQLKEAFS